MVVLLLADVCLVSYVAFSEMVSLEGMVRSGGIARESGGVAFAVFGVGGILVSEGGRSRCRMNEIDSSMVSVKNLAPPLFEGSLFVGWNSLVVLIASGEIRDSSLI